MFMKYTSKSRTNAKGKRPNTTGRSTYGRQKKKPFSLFPVLMAAVIIVGGLYWLLNYGNSSQFPLLSWLGGQVSVYRPTPKLNQSEARQLYLQALEAQKAGEVDLAIRLFLELEDSYPGLSNVISWHLAELYQLKPNEGLVQIRLKKLESMALQPEFQAKVLYALMKSHIRAGQADLAKQKIEALQQKFAETDYGKASKYFQGFLALNQYDALWKQAHPEGDLKKAPLPSQVVSWWKAYLNSSPTGTFAMEIINTFKARGHSPSVEEMNRYIQAYIAAGEYGNAFKVAQMRAFQVKVAGIDVLKAYLSQGKKAPALDLLNAWIGPYRFENEGLQAVLAGLFPLKSASKEGLVALKRLHGFANPANKEAVLWHLSQYDWQHQATYYQQFAKRYPNSRFSPFVQAELIRFDFVAQRLKDLPRHASIYLKRFPESLEAPDVLLWKALAEDYLYELKESQKSLEHLLKDYPFTYSAFRANHLLYGKKDPYSFKPIWAKETLPFITNSLNVSADWLNDYAEESGDLPPILVAQLQELAEIKAHDDVFLLLEMSLKPNSPHLDPLKSWAYLLDGQLDRSIRTIKHSLNNLDSPKTRQERYELSPSLRKLLFPIHYPDFIQQYAEEAGVSPFLVLGLIRQESSFNPNSLSGSSAVGLMQLLVPTAQDMILPSEKAVVSKLALMDPETNIQLGTRYLAYLNKRLASDPLLVVASYNAGPNAVARWANKRLSLLRQKPDVFVEQIPYDQTRHYVHHVFEGMWNYYQLYNLN
jgi:outer membrane protein assembly factor BamD (BamD/ComL family)